LGKGIMTRPLTQEEKELVPYLNARMKVAKCCVDNFTQSDWEDIKAKLGPQWGHYSRDHLQKMGINIRKMGALERVREKNRGANPLPKPPEWYQDYLKTAHWLRHRVTVKEFWGCKCAICNQPGNDVHHRTHERLGCEELTDCILLCRKCHDLVERAKKYRQPAEESDLFAGVA
jgi:hypothetical protein